MFTDVIDILEKLSFNELVDMDEAEAESAAYDIRAVIFKLREIERKSKLLSLN